MKPATNWLAGAVVELERGAHLLDDAVMHDHDLVGHGHGLDLVVRDVDRRGLQTLVQFLDLGAHRDAQLGVEVGQRLVEQEHLRVAHDGAAHGDALALAARQLPGIALEQRGQRQDFRSALDAGRDFIRACAAQLERKAHIVGDRHVRIERVVLEHHGNVALFGLDIVDHAVADRNRARGDVFEAGEHPQQGRLAATGGADEHDELAILDRNRHAVQNFKIAERLSHVANLYRRHRLSPHFLFCGATGGR